MLSIRKLAALPKRTRIRKTALLLQGMETDLRNGKPADIPFIMELFSLLEAENTPPGTGAAGREALSRREALSARGTYDNEIVARVCNRARHEILDFCGVPQADWDLVYPEGEVAGPGRGFPGMGVFLDEIRSPFNVGSVFRTAESFGFGRVVLAPGTASPDHPRARRTAMGTVDLIPWAFAGCGALRTGLPVFALETGGTEISRFRFPREGLAILGNEELGISREARDAAAASWGIVSIPRFGRKGSLNLSVAFGILAYSWTTFLASSEAPDSSGASSDGSSSC